MKIIFDATKCNGYGICAQLCPTMFMLDEFGFPEVLLGGDVPAAEVESAREAIHQCPERAIVEAL